MRDPARIPRICAKLQQLWEKYPDLRFGQFLFGYYKDGELLFYEEDDLVEEWLDELLEKEGGK